MTILENMSMADNKGKPFNLLPCVNRKKAEEYRSMLAQLGLGLEDKMGVPVGNLSGGRRNGAADEHDDPDCVPIWMSQRSTPSS